ncbi:MAG: dipeptidase [Hyphomonadaceae bacterium]
MKLAPFIATALVCAPTLALAQEASPQERARIERILRRTPLIDGHNDVPWEIRDSHANELANVDLNADTRQLTPPMHTDIPRLRRGYVGGQFWSVYVPASVNGLDHTRQVMEQIDLTRRMIAQYPRAFEYAESADDIVRIHRAGRIASMIGIEGGEAIQDNLALLRQFHAMGALYMTLTHGENTAWVDSATAAPQHGGLTPFGEEVVREMNRIGMLVDLSHVSADAMRDALAVAQAPVIFSHSSAFAVAHHPRNVPDDVLALVRENGGVVMVNFTSPFINENFRQWAARRSGAEAEHRALNPGDPTAAAAGLAAWEAQNPAPAVNVGHVADHIEHIVETASYDNVGLGADYDGVTYLPENLGGVDGYTNLLAELIRRGWSDQNIAKLAGGNLLRALRQAERVAAES